MKLFVSLGLGKLFKKINVRVGTSINIKTKPEDIRKDVEKTLKESKNKKK
jgi:hypothetical protein